MFITFLMVSILLIALSLLCVLLANFSLKKEDTIPEKEWLISPVVPEIMDQSISVGVADNLVYDTLINPEIRCPSNTLLN